MTDPKIVAKVTEEFFRDFRPRIHYRSIDKLEELLNPYNAIGSVGGALDGMYGSSDWSGRMGRQLSCALQYFPDGDAFLETLLTYARDSLPVSVDFDDLAHANVKVQRVSHCMDGAIGREAIFSSLQQKGFYAYLDPVYATLEIVLSRVLPEPELAVNSLLELHLHIETELSSMREDRLQDRARQHQYRVLAQHASASYARASELLAGIDIAAVKNAIADEWARRNSADS